MKTKRDLIRDIKFFFINNDIEGSIDLTEISRSFVTSTGEEEVEITKVRESGFSYSQSGNLEDEEENIYEVLPESDILEILDALDDYKTDLEKTAKRCRD